MKLSFWFAFVGLMSSSPQTVFAEGDLDVVFGVNGVQIVDSSQGNSFGLTPPLVQGDGKIVVCGPGLSTDATHFAGFVSRLNPDGSPDIQFGESGRVELATHFIDPPCTGLVLQRDGKIVIATINGIDATIPITDEETQVVRLNADGSLDASFGVGGIAHVNFVRGANDGATALAIQPDGAIVLGVAVYPNTFGIARITEDGADDESFGSDGKVSLTFPVPSNTISDVRGVIVDAQGRIVVAGSVGPQGPATSAFAAARVLSNGSVDASFGSDGYTVFGPEGASSSFPEVALLQRDGRIVLAGTVAATGHNPDVAVTRLLEDGAVDVEFGDGGFTEVPNDFVTDGVDTVFGGLIRSDGTIVLVGEFATNGPSLNQGYIMQLDQRGNLVEAFGSGGVRTYDLVPDQRYQAFGGIAMRDSHYVIAGSAGDGGSITTFVAQIEGPMLSRGHSRHARPIRSGFEN
jgi:uncharacterized delta-60 repeat protein